MKRTADLRPSEVKAMGLREFEERFGWRPVDALEKYYFAGSARRITPIVREALQSGVLGPLTLSDVVMTDEA
jgi:hypothetical protein